MDLDVYVNSQCSEIRAFVSCGLLIIKPKRLPCLVDFLHFMTYIYIYFSFLNCVSFPIFLSLVLCSVFGDYYVIHHVTIEEK